MPNCLIGLGSNLGNRQQTLQAAVTYFRKRPEIERLVASSWYGYPAIGGPPGQTDFLNGTIRFHTDLPPHELARLLSAAEARGGRERRQRWAARTLDCDLLLYGTEQIDSPTLQVPHPRMIARRFVLEPAAEVAAEMIHPDTGWTIRQLLEHLRSAAPYFAVIGSNPTMVDRLTQQTTQRVGGLLLEEPSCRDSSRLEWSGELESARQRSWLLRRHGLDAVRPPISDRRPRVSNFWFWQSLWEPIAGETIDLANRKRNLMTIELTTPPKLLLIVEPIGSHVRRLLATLDPSLRVPTMYLSQRPEDALQDAVGAILSMS